MTGKGTEDEELGAGVAEWQAQNALPFLPRLLRVSVITNLPCHSDPCISDLEFENHKTRTFSFPKVLGPIKPYYSDLAQCKFHIFLSRAEFREM